MIPDVLIDVDSRQNLLLMSIFNRLSELGMNVQNTTCYYKSAKDDMFIMVNKAEVKVTDFIPKEAVQDG